MSITQHVGAAVLAIVIGFGAVLPASQRAAPISIDEATVLTPMVMPGDSLAVQFTVDRSKVCPTTAYVTIFDGGGIEWRVEPDERPAFGPAGVETKTVRYVVPPGATPGRGRYRLVLDFRCNWTHYLAPVTLSLPDLPFIIGDPQDGPQG